MIEHPPHRRPVYGRNHASAHTPDDRTRRAQARRAAEALFAPKQKPSSAQQSRVLSTALPPAQSEAMASITAPPRPTVIPAGHVARIHTWVKYGMTVPQVAAIYGAEVDEVARILGKA